MINKFALDMGMSFDIPNEEKKIAQKANEFFMQVVNNLKLAEDQLNILQNAFESEEVIDPEVLHEKRGVLARFKKQVEENFQKIKYLSILAMKELNNFSTDSHISELINSFRDSITQLAKLNSDFIDMLDDYKAKDFKEKIKSLVENLIKHFDETEKLIKERIISHIDENILVKNWANDLSEEMKIKLDQEEPLIQKLFNERQKAMEGGNATPQAINREQALTPALMQRMLYPADAREVTTTGV